MAQGKKRSRYRWRQGVFLIIAIVFIVSSYFVFPDACYACGTPGKDGPASISGVVNTYYGSTASVSAGATAITLTSSKGSGPTIQPDDLVLIIQMQDASINSSDTDAYGNGVGGDITMAVTTTTTTTTTTNTTTTTTVPANSKLLTVTKSGTGSGTVVSDVSGINCGAICAAWFIKNTKVTLTATPDSGSVFKKWSGDCSGTNLTCTKGMSSSRSVTAEFEVSTTASPVIPSPNAASGATSLNNTGLYEYNIAKLAVGSSGGVLTLAKPLLNAYTHAAPSSSAGQKRFQVVRVPQYSSVKIVNRVTALPWDGNVGGLVVFDVAGQLDFNGQLIDVSSMGFRGGLGVGDSYDNTPVFVYASENINSGYKGEGVAGTPTFMWDGLTSSQVKGTGYPGGNRGMGAPGNAGGGGSYDAAGGGGANGGAGGRGGDEYCPTNPPERPDGTLSICGFIADRSSDDHTPGPLGGMGGEVASGALSYTRILMGGGGGGGADHNSSGKEAGGGRGGGIVLIRAGTSTGGGNIRANGQDAARLDPSRTSGNGSGGGAGGTVILMSGSSLSGLTIEAKGGKGLDVTNHGPGGGGGGGVVYQSGVASVGISGGSNGQRTTDDPLGSLNATPGSAGKNTIMGSGTLFPGGGGGGGVCLPVLTVTKITKTPVRAVTDTIADYEVTVSNQADKGTATGINIVDDLPSPLTYSSTPVTITYTGGATGPVSPMTGSGTDPVTLGTAGGSPSFTIPGGGSVTIAFSVLINGGTGLFQNPAATSFLDPTRTASGQVVTPGGLYKDGTTVGGSNYDSSSSTNEDVFVGNVELTLTKSVRTVSDPVNGVTNPKAISGAFVDYTMTVTNSTPVDVDDLFLSDGVPPEGELFVGNVGGGGSPVLFTDGSTPSGLTYSFVSLGSTTDDLEFSNNGGATFTYVPVAGAFTVDPLVTHIRIKPKGTLKKNTDAKFTFRVRIK